MKGGCRLSSLRLFQIRFVAPLLILAGSPALSAPAAPEKPAIEPRADEWLKRMGDYLRQASFFTVNAEIWQDLELSSGQRIQAGRTIELQVQRPNRLHVQVHSPRRNRELTYDGSAITLLNRVRNLYGTIRAPGALDEALDVASDRFGIAMPLEDFIRSDPRKDLLEHTLAAVDIGSVNVMGVPCEHLAFTQDKIDWQLWIEEGARPVPRKFVITYKDEPDSPQFTAIFTKWDFTTRLSDSVFKFEPPPGAARIKVQEMKALNQAQYHQPK